MLTAGVQFPWCWSVSWWCEKHLEWKFHPSLHTCDLLYPHLGFPQRKLWYEFRISKCLLKIYHKTKWSTNDLLSVLSQEKVSHPVVSDSLRPHGLHSPRNSPNQNTGVGSLSFSRGSSQPRDQTQVSCIAGGFFTSWASRKAHRSQSQTQLKWLSMQVLRSLLDAGRAQTTVPTMYFPLC